MSTTAFGTILIFGGFIATIPLGWLVCKAEEFIKSIIEGGKEGNNEYIS